MNTLDNWAIPLKLNCVLDSSDSLQVIPCEQACTFLTKASCGTIDLSLKDVKSLRDKLTEVLEAHKVEDLKEIE